MPGPYIVTVANGQTVSSAFFIDKPCGLAVIEVASFGTASNVTLEFTQTSGTAPFSPLQRTDGSGQAHAVFSGTGGGWAAFVPPTPFGRVKLGASQSAVTTFTILGR
jgi:hypothetical protein